MPNAPRSILLFLGALAFVAFGALWRIDFDGIERAFYPYENIVSPGGVVTAMTLTAITVTVSYRDVHKRWLKSMLIGIVTFLLLWLQAALTGIMLPVPFTNLAYFFYGEWSDLTFATLIALPFSILAAILCGVPRAATK